VIKENASNIMLKISVLICVCERERDRCVVFRD